MNGSTIFGFILAAFFIGSGAICLALPERIQDSALRYYDRNRHRRLARLNSFLSWMRTSQYILSLRITGMVTLVAGLLALGTLLREVS